MLRYEDAALRLKSFQIADREKRLVVACGELPDRAATVGRFLLTINATGQAHSWQERNALHEKALTAANALTVGERKKLFDLFFPSLSAHVEAGWQLRAGLPYQSGGNRRGYRAPGDSSAHTLMRLHWLRVLHSTLVHYEPDIVWVATWAAYIAGYSSADHVGILLGAAIEKGGKDGEQVFEILKDSASNQHEIAGMGRHVTRALLVCSRPEAWEFVEKLLLAAQRQEGLRSVILETIDEAHPTAFRRMMHLILDQNLLRFSSVVRAVDVWFGLQWSALTPAVLRKTIERALHLIDSAEDRDQALATASGEEYFFALWALASEDANAAIPRVLAARDSEDVERRYIAAYFLRDLQLPAAATAALQFLDDADLRVAVRALSACRDSPELCDPLMHLLGRLPERDTISKPLVWPWAAETLSRTQVANRLPNCLGKRPPTALIPFLPAMSSYTKRQVIEKLSEQKRWDDQTRDTLFSLIGDKESYVRAGALAAIKECKVSETEARHLEGLLSRKTSDLRRAVLTLLCNQKGPAILASADRLLALRKSESRLGGLELLRQRVEAGHDLEACKSRVETYCAKYPEPSPAEAAAIEAVRDAGKPVPTLNDALGLMGTGRPTPPRLPRLRKVPFLTKASSACLQALDELIHEHRTTAVTLPTVEGPREILLANIYPYQFPDPDLKVSPEKDIDRLPLAKVWQTWEANRPKNQRDRDGFELLRALIWADIHAASWKRQSETCEPEWKAWYAHVNNGLELPQLRFGSVQRILRWLVRLAPPPGAADFLLDTLESSFALVDESVLARQIPRRGSYQELQKEWRNYNSPVHTWHSRFLPLRDLLGPAWSESHSVRYWQLMHWRDQPAPGVARYRPDLTSLFAALKNKQANEADLYDQLLGPDQDFRDLQELTRYHPPHPELASVPGLPEAVHRCRERILDIELTRGENPTAASAPANGLRSVSGLTQLMQFLAALGKRPFKNTSQGEGRQEVFTHLVSVTYPLPIDTPEIFAARLREARIPLERILQLGFLAPQWLRHVEHTVGWDGLREGAWWMMTHSGATWALALGADNVFSEGWDRNKASEQMVRERSTLTPEQRSSGHFDVEWFRRVHGMLGSKRWQALAEAARVSFGNSDLRKGLYAGQVVLGKVKKSELVKKIREKFSREGVRLLGLLPLARGAGREADLQGRYRVFMSYRRYARSLSPMGREGALQDLAIGLGNLARTAGYPDPIRLEWAMEAREIADLAAGPVSVTQKGVTVTLRLTPENQPELTIRRGEKPLKSIPPDVRKLARITALTERQGELRRQASRLKQSLEAMMVRGDTFTGAELRTLFTHALLRPLLERLVLVGEGILGYPVADGQALEDHLGKKEPVKQDETLRLAHPVDLYAMKDWAAWQKDCFARERVQPFKQVFRELYVPTAQEKEDGNVSSRYAEQQVNPRQAMALFGSRGWHTRDELNKTFAEADLVAEVSFRHHGGTALEVEGLTFDKIWFRRRNSWKPIPLEEVPPRIFSEVMRDGDLVVSVAHVGGVDPESSASTVQMREALVRETCSLLGIRNYQINKQHVVIEGQLGQYSVHLGSGVVHRLPGGHVCIVPVHAQHRGRLFLPFADDDPRTAEVVSKVMLLTRDHEIQDPTILEQLR